MLRARTMQMALIGAVVAMTLAPGLAMAHEIGEFEPNAPGQRGPSGLRGGPGFGQGERGTMRPGARGRGLQMALGHLDLSEAQRDEIRAIFEAGGDDAQATQDRLRTLLDDLELQIEADPFDEEAVRVKAAAIADLRVEMAVERAKHFGQVREVLTAEQLEKLELMKEMRQSRREQRRERFEQFREKRRSVR